MPRYFFDLINGYGPVRDEEGQDMADRASVIREVSRIATDIARDELPGREDQTISVRVRNETGEPVYSADLSFTASWHDE